MQSLQSLNQTFPKATYSVHKSRNLQKEHVACTPDGKVLFVDGPYFADGHNDDYLIWESIVEDPDHDIHRIFPGQDADGQDQKYTFFADRGYSHCHENDTFDLKIPHGIQKEAGFNSKGEKIKKAKRLTTEQRNTSKLNDSFFFWIFSL